MVAYDGNNLPTVAICSVSGTTPTCGTPVSLASVNSFTNISAAALDSSHVAVAYQDDTNSDHPTVATCSVSGTTPTCDTPVSLVSDTGNSISSAALDSSHLAVAYSNGSSHTTLVVSQYASASASAPTVTTQSASVTGQTTATANGNITATNGATATVRGFAYGTNSALSGGDTATSTDTAGQPFSTGAYTGSLTSLTCNTTYYSRAYATNSAGTGYGAISSSFTTRTCNPTYYSRAYATNSAGTGYGAISSSFTTRTCNPTGTPITITSTNASTTLAKVGNVITVTFTSDQTSLIAPTVSIAGHATTTALNTSGNIWAASTTMASGDTEGTIAFLLNVGNSDGYGTTTPSAVTGSNPTVRFDKTAPVVTISGSNPDTQSATGRNSYSDSGATATDSYDGSVSVSTSGSVDLTTVGTYTLTYTATDAAGNSSSASRSVAVTAAPTNGPVAGGGGGGGGGPVPVALPNNGSTASATAHPQGAIATVAGLQAELQALLAQIATLKEGASASASVTRDLTVGATGSDVTALQAWLNGHGFIVVSSGAGSPGSETTYFGSKTFLALKKFQKAVGISPASGYFGPKTRTYIAAHP